MASTWLIYGLCFDPIDVTVLYISKIGENDSARFTIFLGEHSLYNAKEFEGLLNSYFTISLVILFVLPVLAIFFKISF